MADFNPGIKNVMMAFSSLCWDEERLRIASELNATIETKEAYRFAADRRRKYQRQIEERYADD